MRSVIAVAVLAAVSGVALGATPEDAPIRWEPYQLKVNAEPPIDAQIGSIVVPARRGGRGTARLTLRFVRLAALGRRTGGPIVYLAGGPGSSGIEAGTGPRRAMFQALREHGDVILLDQRGVGLSSPPPACSHRWTFPNDQASTEALINASLEAVASRCMAEWQARGVDLDAFNTSENAADVADLIRALGPTPARLLAISYGTFLGLAVLRDNPRVVDRVVFAGVEGPDDTVKLPTQADDALERYSVALGRHAQGAMFTPDFKSTVARVFETLGRHPASVTLTGGTGGASSQITISQYDAQIVAAFFLATSENARRLPALFSAADNGNFSDLAQAVVFLRRFAAQLPAMPLAMDAASTVSAARASRVESLTTASIFGNAVNFPSADFGAALHVAPLPARFRAPVRSKVPALFISGTLDSRTPVGNAEAVRRTFTRSSHLVIEGAGHDNDLFLSSPTILARIREFLDGRTLRNERITVDLLVPRP